MPYTFSNGENSVMPVMDRPGHLVLFTKLFIDNQWRSSSSGGYFSVLDPATEKVLCRVDESNLEDVEMAVIAARRAFAPGSPWRNMDASARGTLLHRLADLIDRDSEHLAKLDTYSGGRTIKSSLRDVQLLGPTVRFYAGLADKIHGETIPADGDIFCMTRQEPIGVCALIISWNFPLLMLLGKMSPALCCGNTVVVKPARQTPLSTLHVASLVQEAGFPPGVVNMVPGSGSLLGKALSEHMDVDMVSFTGSTSVGQLVQEAAARSNCKRTVLSLSGKSPIAVFPDADLEKAVLWCHRAVFTHQGQICCSGSRTYVHEDIYEEFVQRSLEAISTIVIGDPLREETTHGPQIDEASLFRITRMIKNAVLEGAQLECGGKRHGARGFFLEPTLFSDVHDDMEIAREEVFGPVQLLLKFRTLDEVIERSNKTKYGLAAGVFTSNIDTALAYSKGVRAGTVWVNNYLKVTPQTPYGGFKMSGHGKEMGYAAAKDYLQTKTISIQISPKL